MINTWDNLFKHYGFKRIKRCYNCRFYFNKEKEMYAMVDELLKFVEIGTERLPYTVLHTEIKLKSL